jgi:hypothetical protein
LGRIRDVHHSDFDCCAYLLFYTVLAKACWHGLLCIAYVFVTYVQPSDASYGWGMVFLLALLYHTWRVADAARELFHALGGMLSGDPRLLFSPTLTIAFVRVVGLVSYFLGAYYWR